METMLVCLLFAIILAQVGNVHASPTYRNTPQLQPKITLTTEWCGKYKTMFFADFDGNGSQDILCFESSTGSLWGMKLHFAPDGPHREFVAMQYDTNPPVSKWCVNGKISVANFNDDAMDDLFCDHGSGISSGLISLGNGVWKELGSKGWIYAETDVPSINGGRHCNFCRGNCYWNQRLIVDLNNDGISEYICFRYEDGVVNIKHGAGGGLFKSLYHDNKTGWCSGGSHMFLHAADLDGDGKKELICHNDETGRFIGRTVDIKIEQVNGKNVATSLTLGPIVQMGSSAQHHDRDPRLNIQFLDVNGDGTADLLISATSTGSWNHIVYTKTDMTLSISARLSSTTNWCISTNLYTRQLWVDVLGNGSPAVLCIDDQPGAVHARLTMWGCQGGVSGSFCEQGICNHRVKSSDREYISRAWMSSPSSFDWDLHLPSVSTSEIRQEVSSLESSMDIYVPFKENSADIATFQLLGPATPTKVWGKHPSLLNTCAYYDLERSARISYDSTTAKPGAELELKLKAEWLSNRSKQPLEDWFTNSPNNRPALELVIPYSVQFMSPVEFVATDASYEIPITDVLVQYWFDRQEKHYAYIHIGSRSVVLFHPTTLNSDLTLNVRVKKKTGSYDNEMQICQQHDQPTSCLFDGVVRVPVTHLPSEPKVIRIVDSCFPGYFGECSSGTCAEENRVCTCMGALTGSVCATLKHGKNVVTVPASLTGISSENLHCPEELPSTIDCSDLRLLTHLAVCGATQSDPIFGANWLLEVLSCSPKLATSTQDPFAGGVAGGRTSIPAFVYDLMGRNALFVDRLSIIPAVAKAYAVAEHYSLVGASVVDATLFNRVMEPFEVSEYVALRMPVTETCTGTCPCGTRLTFSDDSNLAPTCEQVVEAEELEVAMNYLRCATIPEGILVEKALASSAMFASASFHCLNRVLLRAEQERSSDGAEEIDPSVERATQTIVDTVVELAKSNPLLIDLSQRIERVGSLLSRDFLRGNDNNGTVTFRVPPLQKDAYSEQLTKFDDQLYKLEQKLRIENLKDFAAEQFATLHEQIEELRDFTAEKMDQLRSDMTQGFNTVLNEFKTDTETVLKVIELEIEVIYDRVELIRERSNKLDESYRASVKESDTALDKLIDTSQEITKLVHEAEVVDSFKPVVLARQALNKANAIRDQKYDEWQETTFECQLNIVFWKWSQVLNWIRVCLEDYKELVAQRERDYLSAKDDASKALQKKNEALAQYEATESGFKMNDFETELDRIDSIIDRLNCARAKLLHRVSEKTNAFMKSYNNEDGTEIPEFRSSTLAFNKAVCSGEMDDDPVLSIVLWDIANAEMDSLAKFSGLCKAPPLPDDARRLGNPSQLMLQRASQLGSNESLDRSLSGKFAFDPFQSTVDGIAVADMKTVSELSDAKKKIRKKYFGKLDSMNDACVDFLTGFRGVTAHGKVYHEQLIELEESLVELSKFKKSEQIYLDRLDNTGTLETTINSITMVSNGKVPKLISGPVGTEKDYLDLTRMMVGNFISQEESLALTDTATAKLALLCGAVAYTDPGDRSGQYGRYCRPLPIYPATDDGVESLRKLLEDANNNLAKPIASSKSWIDQKVEQGWETNAENVILEISMLANLRKARANKFTEPIKFEMLGPGREFLTPYFAFSNVRMTEVGLFFTDDDANPLGGNVALGVQSDSVQLRIDLTGMTYKNVESNVFQYNMPNYEGLTSGYSLPTDGKCLNSDDSVNFGLLCKSSYRVEFKTGSELIALPSPYRTWSVEVVEGHEYLMNATRVFILGSVVAETGANLPIFDHPLPVSTWSAELQDTFDIPSDSALIPAIAGALGGVAVIGVVAAVVYRRRQSETTISGNNNAEASNAEVYNKAEVVFATAVTDTVQLLQVQKERNAARKFLSRFQRKEKVSENNEVTTVSTAVAVEASNPMFEI